MTNKYRWLAMIVIVVFVEFSALAGEKKESSARVAVLELDSPETAKWLGGAVSEAIRCKLAGLDGVTLLERERVRELLLAAKGAGATPELLGAQFLLIGSVQLVGTWPDENAKLRISARIVGAETATIKGEAAFVVDGAVGKLFELETELAGKFARAIGKEPTALQVEYREELNLAAKRLFGEGLLNLREAEKLSASIKAEENLRQAVDQFRQAQQANEGAFYARAHFYEGRARELLAGLQADDVKAKAIREETVAQFRQDAAEAAPAFYDLGLALKENGDYKSAIDAFQRYLQWMSGKDKVIRWQTEVKARGGVPYYFGTNIPYENTYFWWANILETPSFLMTIDTATITVFNRHTHQKIWEKKASGNIVNCYSGNDFCNGNETVLVKIKAETLTMFETPTGKELLSIELLLPEAHKNKKTMKSMIYLLPGKNMPEYIAIAKIVFDDLDDGLFQKTIDVIDVKKQAVVWRTDWEEKCETQVGLKVDETKYIGLQLPYIWNNTLIFCKGAVDNWEYLDVATGKDAAQRFSPEIRNLIASETREYDDLRPPLFLPDSSGNGIYLCTFLTDTNAVYWNPKRLKPIYHLASPQAKPTVSPVTRVLYGCYGYGNVIYSCKDCSINQPWLVFDHATGCFDVRHEKLPLLKEKGDQSMRCATLESPGTVMGNRFVWRKHEAFKVYDLNKEKPPTLVFEYTNHSRVFSDPIINKDSMYFYGTMDANIPRFGFNDSWKFYLYEVGFPGKKNSTSGQPAALWQVADCHEKTGALPEAIKTLKQAVSINFNLPEYHERLVDLLQNTGRNGEASLYCDNLIDLKARNDDPASYKNNWCNHPAAREYWDAYGRLLGRVSSVPLGSNECALSCAFWKSLFIYTQRGKIIAVDLDKNKVAWENNFHHYYTRIYKRGNKIFASSGWWNKDAPLQLASIDPQTGNVMLVKTLTGPYAFSRRPPADEFVYAGTDEWQEKLPVIYMPRIEESGTVIAVDPVSLETLWKFDLPKVSDTDLFYEHAIQLDRVILAAVNNDNANAKFFCLDLHTGKLIWENVVPVNKATLDRRLECFDLQLSARGSTISFFPSVNPKNGDKCWGAIDTKTGEVVEKASAPSWWKINWHPKGKAMALDPNENLKSINLPKKYVYNAGAIWEGGPNLCYSLPNVFSITDRHSHKVICSSPVGLEALFFDEWYASIEGNYLHCYSLTPERYAHHLIFHLPTFLRAIGWTEELEAKYRTK
jgi:outer membrane protein assembly factor BamB/TolB-like protein